MKKYLLTSLAFNIIALFILTIICYRNREDILQSLFEKHLASPTIALLGDSHTARGDWNSLLHRTDVLRAGIFGFTSEQDAKLIKYTIGKYPIHYCFILSGTNDVDSKDFSVTGTIANYQAIIDSLGRQKAVPIFQTVPYVCSNGQFNTKVDSLNNALRRMCVRQSIDVIDLNSALALNHELNPDLSNADNIHLNKKGYQVWSGLLSQYIEQHKL